MGGDPSTPDLEPNRTPQAQVPVETLYEIGKSLYVIPPGDPVAEFAVEVVRLLKITDRGK